MTQTVEVSQESAQSRPAKVPITTPTLLRLAGLSALLAGICYVFVGVFHPANVASSVTTTRWEIVHFIACAMCFFGLLGMASHARQAKKVGWLGLIGYVLFSLWLVLIMGFSFVEAFILPRLATTDPKFVVAWMGMLVGPASNVYLGALPGLWTLMHRYTSSVACFRHHDIPLGILPRWAAHSLPSGPHWPLWPQLCPTRISRRPLFRWG